ncbi:hypothetical protein SGLAM104S_02629 [Streptomyces glaucescens]
MRIFTQYSAAANDAPARTFRRFVPGLAEQMVHDGPLDDGMQSGPRTPEDNAEDLLRAAQLAARDSRRPIFAKRVAEAARAADLHDLAEALERRAAPFPYHDPAGDRSGE